MNPTRTMCPYCRLDAFDEADESCDSCGFHRCCLICGQVISDKEALLLDGPQTCGAVACRNEWWDQANIPWEDNL